MSVTPQELALFRRPATGPTLPTPRGELSGFLCDHLVKPVHELPAAPSMVGDPLADEDLVLALYCCYELHYRGFDTVPAEWEWEPSLLALRRRLERSFEAGVTELAGPVQVSAQVEERLKEIIAAGAGPSLSTYMAEQSTLEQLIEFAVHRSAYQLKEADPHSWALPRLAGAAKAALVEIQADEYGQGVQKDMHSELFALSLRELGLDDRYGAYLDHIPAPTLATVNLVSLFGLHRRWRGALVGHLAVFEMTSVEPMGRYSVALRRHGFGPWARLFYDTHVVADAHHQTLAARNLAGGLVGDEPDLLADILFGAQAITALEQRFTRHVLGAWATGASSLHPSAHARPTISAPSSRERNRVGACRAPGLQTRPDDDDHVL